MSRTYNVTFTVNVTAGGFASAVVAARRAIEADLPSTSYAVVQTNATGDALKRPKNKVKTHDYPACAVFRGGNCTCDD